MKRYTKLCTVLAGLVLPFLLYNPLNTNAVSYVTPDGEELYENFDVGAKDVVHLEEWLKERNTFPVIESNSYKTQAWINVPNVQNLLYGKIDGIFVNGYIESGVDMDFQSKGSLFETNKDGALPVERFGFAIPSPTYIGEYPVISYQISSVLPKGVWGTIKSSIRGLFGGTILDPPESADDFASLKYENLTDYVEDYSMTMWIGNNWDNVCSTLEPGQALLPKSLTGNREGKMTEADGTMTSYTYQTCIIDRGLETVQGSPEEFNRRLKADFGQYYEPIMACMVALNGEDSLTKFTLRDMPYDVAVDTSGMDVSLVRDPRCDVGDYMGIIHQQDKEANSHKSKASIVNFFGKVAGFTRMLDQITKFEFLEEHGVDLSFFYKSRIMQILYLIISIYVLVKLVKIVLEISKGNMGTGTGVLKGVVCFMIGAFCIGVFINGDKTYNTAKSLVVTLSSIGETEDTKGDMKFWVPYFEMWSIYNTNHGYRDGTQVIDTGSGKNEVIGIDTHGETKWNLLLARSFTSSYKIDANAYRCVDHFLAPRFEVTGDSITTTTNENFNGDIQTRVGYEWIKICNILVAELVKVFFFFNMCLELMFLIVFAIINIKTEGIMPTIYSFLSSIGVYCIVSTFVCVISDMNTNSQFIPNVLNTAILVIGIAALVSATKKLPYYVTPRILRFAKNRRW